MDQPSQQPSRRSLIVVLALASAGFLVLVCGTAAYFLARGLRTGPVDAADRARILTAAELGFPPPPGSETLEKHREINGNLKLAYDAVRLGSHSIARIREVLYSCPTEVQAEIALQSLQYGGELGFKALRHANQAMVDRTVKFSWADETVWKDITVNGRLGGSIVFARAGRRVGMLMLLGIKAEPALLEKSLAPKWNPPPPHP